MDNDYEERVRIDLHVHGLSGNQDNIANQLQQIITNQGTIMATLQELIAAEADENAALAVLGAGLQTLLDSVAKLKADLADALSGTTLPPSVQAQIDNAFAAHKENADMVAADIAKLAAP